jgi:hypothetical protein
MRPSRSAPSRRIRWNKSRPRASTQYEVMRGSSRPKNEYLDAVLLARLV